MQKITKKCVEINSKVLVRFLSDQIASYLLTDSRLTDPDHGVISFESPLGKALLGKSQGDKVVYSVGNHTIEAEIIEIS